MNNTGCFIRRTKEKLARAHDGVFTRPFASSGLLPAYWNLPENLLPKRVWGGEGCGNDKEN
jgi:hypothetical protein